jgi:hypothetical protein
VQPRLDRQGVRKVGIWSARRSCPFTGNDTWADSDLRPTIDRRFSTVTIHGLHRPVSARRHDDAPLANDGSSLILNWLVLNLRFLEIQSPCSVARPLHLSALSSRIQQVHPAR